MMPWSRWRGCRRVPVFSIPLQDLRAAQGQEGEGDFLYILRCLVGTHWFSASVGGVRLLGALEQGPHSSSRQRTPQKTGFRGEA